MEKENIISFRVRTNDIPTKPYNDQKPGTSGLRKKVKVFLQENYLNNFVQCIFSAHQPEEYKGKTLIVGGDGRYYNDVAIDLIIRIALGNGVKKILVPKSGVFSTPCVSVLIRKTPNCFGGIILSASHNPGGINEDFGIKFNSSNGAPSNEGITKRIYDLSLEIKSFQSITGLEEENFFGRELRFNINNEEGYEVNIVDTTKDYVELMREEFDFDLIEKLFNKKGFLFVFDAMHGASGPYAQEIFGNIFKVNKENLLNCDVLPDFGGHHPDPNLVYAKELVSLLNIKKDSKKDVVQFGAACDGDADRNMILGWECFVSPSDSLAIIAANSFRIKAYNKNKERALHGVARSMPTSSAVDRVAKKLGIQCYEVPTGWKFFGNLMDDNRINLCGEESFGTSSNHIREKDGLWAVLCWLSILADYNKNHDELKVTIKDIVEEHWKTYGRDYYCRYDYEELPTEIAEKITKQLEDNFESFSKESEHNKAYIFEYKDPVDGSISKNQGWIFSLGESRIIFRKSGTSSTGATIRIYFEKYSQDSIGLEVGEGIKDLVEKALKLSKINEISSRTGPSVIT